MGTGNSKNNQNLPPAPSLPAPTTITASTSSSTTTLVSSTGEKRISDNPQFLYILLACIPAVLLTVLVFTTIYFIRKMKIKDHQRPQKTSPEQDPEDTVHQAPDKNTQVPTCPEDEITYADLTFKQKTPPKTDL
ncbi:uncharacterized protein [Emydura macquarii macquarii]|uniref:uncharacterized protein isoform X2 n=1 Tax=Emydura macquarii macquarii TaxID=1129001 RepID=UPI00352B115D